MSPNSCIHPRPMCLASDPLMQTSNDFHIEKSSFKGYFISLVLQQHSSPQLQTSCKIDLENVISMSCRLYFQNVSQIQTFLSISIHRPRFVQLSLPTWTNALFFPIFCSQITCDLQNEVFPDLHI